MVLEKKPKRGEMLKKMKMPAKPMAEQEAEMDLESLVEEEPEMPEELEKEEMPEELPALADVSDDVLIEEMKKRGLLDMGEDEEEMA